jgi:hypothetical protein
MLSEVLELEIECEKTAPIKFYSFLTRLGG